MGLSSIDRATLLIAYALLAVDGDISTEEENCFMQSLSGYQIALDSDCALALLDDCHKLVKNFLKPAGQQSDDELLDMFQRSMLDESTIFCDSLPVIKKSFAIWMSMVLAEQTFSAIERKAIKVLQQLFLRNDGIVISDTFLTDIEDALLTLNNLKAEQANSDEARQQELQVSFDAILASVNDMILDDNY